MYFGVLGPVRVGRDGEPRAIRAIMGRTLFAELLLDANSAVSADRLCEALWRERPPARAVASLHNHVMRLRRELGPEAGARLRTVAPGYLVHVEPEELDADVFAGLCDRGAAAARAGRWERAAADLADALALWRGDVACDVPGVDRENPRVQRLIELRSQAYAGRIEADLQLGRHREVVGELRSLAAANPLNETFHEQLMLALYRVGRQAEALDAYRTLRRLLVDELGVEPSASVQRLHGRILAGDPDLAPPAPAAPRGAASLVSPHVGRGGARSLLPADTRAFTGRARELDELALLAGAHRDGGGAGIAVISAIDGMAGVGKTALAVHVAHRVRGEFPDGQLFLDLHGYTDSLAPMASQDALGWLLRRLGVAPQLIPEDPQERAALYRDRLDGTRTLIVLDNAIDTAQVRPLLPASAGCLVLVTSRRRLAGLDDAHSVALDVLPESEAVALLRTVAGPGRVPEGHPALPELVALCGRLPLAVRIVAARLRHHAVLRPEELVERLRDENARLDQLRDEDRNLTAVFDLSYTSLLRAERHMYRCLGLVPGPDVDAFAAASLAGVGLGTAERTLDALLGHNLLIQHVPGRYRLHDLLRAHARARGGDDPAADRRSALDRLMAYYLHTARAADRHLARETRAGAPPAAAAPQAAQVPPAAPEFADRMGAMAWMRADRENLVAAVRGDAREHSPGFVIALTAALAGLLHQDGPWSQAAELHEAAIALARARGDSLAEAGALGDLGHVRLVSGDYGAAEDMQRRAMAVHRRLGVPLGEANALVGLGQAHYMGGHYAAAAEAYERALPLYRACGDRLGEANALWSLGQVRNMTSDFDDAIGLMRDALDGYRELGHQQGQAATLRDLSHVLTMVGDCSAAAELAERSVEVFRDIGIRKGEANALWCLGRVRYVTGRYAAAARAHESAFAIYDEIGHGQGAAHALWELGRVRRATGDLPEAAAFLERALTTFRELGLRHGEANAMHELGRVLHACGEHAKADDLHARALAAFRGVGDRQGVAEVLISVAALRADTDGPAKALDVYRQALGLAREVRSRLDEARALEGAAACLELGGDRAAAVADLRRAVTIYRGIGAAEADSAAARLALLDGEASAAVAEGGAAARGGAGGRGSQGLDGRAGGEDLAAGGGDDVRQRGAEEAAQVAGGAALGSQAGSE